MMCSVSCIHIIGRYFIPYHSSIQSCGAVVAASASAVVAVFGIFVIVAIDDHSFPHNWSQVSLFIFWCFQSWSSIENNVKSKYTEIKAHNARTGNAPDGRSLTRLEKMVIDTIGPTVADGIEGAVETGLSNFDFNINDGRPQYAAEGRLLYLFEEKKQNKSQKIKWMIE